MYLKRNVVADRQLQTVDRRPRLILQMAHAMRIDDHKSEWANDIAQQVSGGERNEVSRIFQNELTTRSE